jgi:hypothetical protein
VGLNDILTLLITKPRPCSRAAVYIVLVYFLLLRNDYSESEYPWIAKYKLNLLRSSAGLRGCADDKADVPPDVVLVDQTSASRAVHVHGVGSGQIRRQRGNRAGSVIEEVAIAVGDNPSEDVKWRPERTGRAGCVSAIHDRTNTVHHCGRSCARGGGCGQRGRIL